MGQLKLTIGPISASRTIADDKLTSVANIIYADLVIPNWPEDRPLPANAQERLQAVLDRVAIEMRDAARRARAKSLRAEQEAIAAAELELISV